MNKFDPSNSADPNSRLNSLLRKEPDAVERDALREAYGGDPEKVLRPLQPDDVENPDLLLGRGLPLGIDIQVIPLKAAIQPIPLPPNPNTRPDLWSISMAYRTETEATYKVIVDGHIIGFAVNYQAPRGVHFWSGQSLENHVTRWSFSELWGVISAHYHRISERINGRLSDQWVEVDPDAMYNRISPLYNSSFSEIEPSAEGGYATDPQVLSTEESRLDPGDPRIMALETVAQVAYRLLLVNGYYDKTDRVECIQALEELEATGWSFRKMSYDQSDDALPNGTNIPFAKD